LKRKNGKRYKNLMVTVNLHQKNKICETTAIEINTEIMLDFQTHHINEKKRLKFISVKYFVN